MGHRNRRMEQKRGRSGGRRGTSGKSTKNKGQEVAYEKKQLSHSFF